MDKHNRNHAVDMRLDILYDWIGMVCSTSIAYYCQQLHVNARILYLPSHKHRQNSQL